MPTEKAKAAKNSKAKKTDNLETYVYRCDNGNLGIPGEYLRGSVINAAKYRQDPRSPRASAVTPTTVAVGYGSDQNSLRMSECMTW